MIGLKRGIVELDNYNPDWPVQFETEKQKLTELLGEIAIQIEHIGSTAIPGLMAKPVIDIAVGTTDMGNFESIKSILEKNGWVWRPKFGDINSHVVFAKGTDEVRTHYLHLLEFNGAKWCERIAFRDYLRKHKSSLEEYQDLKIKLASSYADDRMGYTAQKNDFVAKILNLCGIDTSHG